MRWAIQYDEIGPREGTGAWRALVLLQLSQVRFHSFVEISASAAHAIIVEK